MAIYSKAISSPWWGRATPRPTASASPANWPRIWAPPASRLSPAWRVASIRQPITARSRPARSRSWAVASTWSIPKQNAALYEEIVARGVVIGEPPLGTVPQAPLSAPQQNHFRPGARCRRRRGSAAIRLAHYCAFGGRTRPRSIRGTGLSARSAQPRLQRPDPDGATLVQGAEDIVEALAGMMQKTLDEPQQDKFSAPDMASVGETELTTARPRVLELLGPSPVPIDELLRQSRLTPALVLTILLELELAGRLERHVGGQVSLIESMR